MFHAICSIWELARSILQAICNILELKLPFSSKPFATFRSWNFHILLFLYYLQHLGAGTFHVARHLQHFGAGTSIYFYLQHLGAGTFHVASHLQHFGAETSIFHAICSIWELEPSMLQAICNI
jgi:hypothetical protein